MFQKYEMDSEQLRSEEVPVAQKVTSTEKKAEPRDTGRAAAGEKLADTTEGWEKENNTRFRFQPTSEPQPQ